MPSDTPTPELTRVSVMHCTSLAMEFVNDDYGNTYFSGDYLAVFGDNPDLRARTTDPAQYVVGTEYLVASKVAEVTKTVARFASAEPIRGEEPPC